MSDPMKSAWDEVAESFSALGRAMKDRYATGAGSASTPEEQAATAAATSTGTGTDTATGTFAGTEDAERGSDPTAALRDAFDQLLAAGRQFSDRAAGLVRDDEVKAQAKHVAATLNSALEATVDQIGKEVRGMFKGGRGDSPIDADEHADTPDPGEVTPPPASAEGDVIP